MTSAVQTATTEGGYEETPIDSEQVQEINKKNANTNKPLFEQLRDNQEEQQAKQEEMQREIMRGTRALNEEDAAHLQALEEQKQAREDQRKAQALEELAMFRTARLERQINVLDADDGEDTEKDVPLKPRKEPPTEERKSSAVIVPVVKKRKRRKISGPEDPGNQKSAVQEPSSPTGAESSTKAESTKSQALGSLLAGYGSSDDSSQG